MKNSPIGFLDSGVGGLTVAKEVMKRLPNEEIYYIGDSGRNPYGPRPSEQVFAYTVQLANFLMEKGIKLLVIACNTATVVALKYLQNELPIPVLGVIEPGSKAAAANSKNKHIGVIGTQGTIQSKEYEKQILDEISDATIQSVACPKFVSIVEKDQYQDDLAKQVVADELGVFDDFEMDTLVLGCTHYPLLQNIIQQYFDTDLTLIDPGVETAKYVEGHLIKNDLLNNSGNDNQLHVFYTTGPAQKFQTIAVNWLKDSNFIVKHIPIEEIEKYGR